MFTRAKYPGGTHPPVAPSSGGDMDNLYDPGQGGISTSDDTSVPEVNKQFIITVD